MQKDFVIALTSLDGKQINMEVKQRNLQVNKRKVKTWTSEEDNQLIELYQRFPKKWNDISNKMGDRNQNQCLHRYRRLSQLGKSHKIWSSEEDETIKKLIKKYGKNWKILSSILGSKNGKQIRERFINKLDPRIKKEEWSDEEDRKVIELYSKFGSKWSEISKHLSGRPQNKIKNRFYSFIQKNYDINFKEVENIKYVSQTLIISDSKVTFNNEQKIYFYEPVGGESHTYIEGRIGNEGKKFPDEGVILKFDIPSISEIDFQMRNQQLMSHNLLDSAFGVHDEWRSHNYQGIAELNSTDFFFKFQN